MKTFASHNYFIVKTKNVYFKNSKLSLHVNSSTQKLNKTEQAADSSFQKYSIHDKKTKETERRI
jgi:hypothetical protein